jgi:diguanylate cyclase (GGDEF)-like protein
VIVAHDITDQKRLQNDLQCANDKLKQQLAEIEELRAKLQEQAIRDPLTNVYNRRYMAEFLDQEIARAAREEYSVSVTIMDMDNFKQFNDTYGHKCGDVVLQSFADFLVGHTRRSDVVCRYGGEEFVILMPNASLLMSYARVEAWRQDFSESVIPYEDLKFSTTFSAGVATFPEHGLTGEEILQAADEALYRSKNRGRNRVSMSARSHS